jgi:hypothetical protein
MMNMLIRNMIFELYFYDVDNDDEENIYFNTYVHSFGFWQYPFLRLQPTEQRAVKRKEEK